MCTRTDPELVQFDKVVELVRRLKRGEVAEMPSINHAQKSIGTTKLTVPSSRILVIEVTPLAAFYVAPALTLRIGLLCAAL